MMEPAASTPAFDSFGTSTYGAYGHREASSGGARTGLAGEIGEADLPWYLLGDRFYLPSLQRFASPDTNSPFDAGGLNRYAYCGGDPINRIDPSGEAWWEWVVAGLGLAAAIAATFVSAGALAAPIAAAAVGGLTATVSTTTMVTLTTAAVLDVVAVVGEIGAIASMAAGDEKATGIFGWVALGTGVASAGLAGLSKVGGNAVAQSGASMATKSRGLSFGSSFYVPTSFRINGDYRRITYTSLNGKHQIKVYKGAAAVEAKIPSRAIRDRSGNIVDIQPEWKAYKNADGGFNYVTDVEIWSSEGLRSLSATLRAQPDSQPVKFLSGVHGDVLGENWSWRGKRMHKDPEFYRVDSNDSRMQGMAGDRQVMVLNTGSMAGTDFKQVIDEGAHIVHSYCFSAADRKLIKRFNVKITKVYEL